MSPAPPYGGKSMKKLLAILTLAAFVSGPAFAAVGIKEAGVYKGEATTINFTTNFTTTNDGSTFAIAATPATSDTYTFSTNSEYIDNTTNGTILFSNDAGNLIVKMLSSGTSDSTVALQLVGDAGANATDGFQIKNNADGTLTIGNDSSVAGTYVTKWTLSSAGVITYVDSETLTDASDVVTLTFDDAAADFIVKAYDATASTIEIWADRGDDAADKFLMSMSAADAFTFTTGATLAATVSNAGLWTFPVGVTSSLATDASSLTVGSIITAGGIACAKQLYVGDDIDMSVSTTGVYDITLRDSVADALSIVRGTTDMMVFDTSSPLITITPAVTITGDLKFASTLFAGGRFGASSSIPSSSNGISASQLAYSLLMKDIGNVAGETATLPNGTAGQLLVIHIHACGPSGTWILSRTLGAGWKTITFDTRGDQVALVYDATLGWMIQTATGVTIDYPVI